MLIWIKEKLRITHLEKQVKSLQKINASYETELQKLASSLNTTQQKLHTAKIDIDNAIQELHCMTAVDADVGIRGNNTIIMTGVLHGKAFVSFYDLGDGEFKRMVYQLKRMKKHHYLRNIDAPMFDFKGSFNI